MLLVAVRKGKVLQTTGIQQPFIFAASSSARNCAHRFSRA